MVATSERRKHLFDVTDSASEAHSEWSESDIPYITDPFQSAVDDMVEVFSTGDIPADCRALNKEVEALTDLWKAWKTAAEVSGDTNTMPSQDFWLAMERVAAARVQAVPKQPVKLETIEQLDKQGVSDRQICVMYEWVLTDGSPDFDKLREERKDPGTHTGEDFVPPQERRRLERQSSQDAAVARARRRREKKLEKMSAEAPESLEQLVAEGVSAEQIAIMRNCTVEQVFAECDEESLQRPESHYAPAQTERGIHGPPINEATDRAMDADVAKRRELSKQGLTEMEEYSKPKPTRPAPWQKKTDEIPGDGPIMTLEQHIVVLYQEGMKPGKIAKTLTTEEETISKQKVNSVIQRYNKEPEVFAATGTKTETPVEA